MLTITSGTILSRSGDNEHPWLVPDLSGKELSLSTLSMMLDIGYG